MQKLKENLNNNNNYMRQLDQIEIYIQNNLLKHKMK